MTGEAPPTRDDKAARLDQSSKAASGSGSGEAASPAVACPKAKVEVTVKRPSPGPDEQPFDCPVELKEAANDKLHRRSGPCDSKILFAGLEPGGFEAAAKVPAGCGYSFKAPKTVQAAAGATARVTIELVKLEVTEVTPTADRKQYINLDRAAVDPADESLGRTVKVKVRISEARKGETVHLFLEPGPDNQKGLTGDLAAEVDATAVTDDKGETEVDVRLSRYGGDRFRLVASLCEDPKHPCAATKASGWFTVWRRVWFHAVITEGFDVPAPQRSVDAWRRVFVEFEDAGAHRFSREDLPAALRSRSFYPRWMLVGGQDETSACAITDFNLRHLHGLIGDDAKKPLKAPLVVGEAMLRDFDTTEPITVSIDALQHDASTNEDYVELMADDARSVIVAPPIQSGNLVVSGRWAIETKAWRAAGAKPSQLWDPPGFTPENSSGALTDADIRLVKGRNGSRRFRVVWPRKALKPTAENPGHIRLVLRRCRSILGLSSGGKVTAVFDPRDVNDYSDTITHEVGHSLGQVAKTRIAPLPANHWYEDQHGGRGDHCHTVNGDQPGTLQRLDSPTRTTDGTNRAVTHVYATGECVMFASFDRKCTGRFCPKCEPYVRIQDMDRWRHSQ